MSIDKKRFRLIQEFGNLLVLEKHDRWFNVFKPSGQFYWHYKGVTTGPFTSTYNALKDYKLYREYMRKNENVLPAPNTPKSTQITVNTTEKPVILPENVIFMDFRKKIRISK
jgi:hypothetical protein